jgi:hypothetical protein
MESKTLEELRALARAAGVRGYSALRKKELVELLKKPGAQAAGTRDAQSSAAPSKRKAAAPKKSSAKTTTAASDDTSADAPITARPARGTTTEFSASAPNVRAAIGEEKIEGSKYELAPPGMGFHQSFESNLNEDIDRLPELGEPVLRLLPQKPGVVHAYWILQHGTNPRSLRLRLCRVGQDAIEVVDEVEINAERGHWYFHAPQNGDVGEYVAQLGHYGPSGQFVTAIHRGIARIPSLYASDRTDRSWWISDEQFRAQYVSAGGKMRGRRLGWGGTATSSRAPFDRTK